MKNYQAFTLLSLVFAISSHVHGNILPRESKKITPQVSGKNNADFFLFKSGVDNKTRVSLGENTERLIANFQVTGHSFQLKDGGTFVEGWRRGYPSEHSASLLTYPDGRLYLAMYDIEKKKIEYFSSAGQRIPRAIQIWSWQFGPIFNKHQLKSRYQQFKLENLKDDVVSQAELFQQIAASIWQPDILSSIDYNVDVIDVVASAQQEVFACAQRVSRVTDPSFMYPLPGITLSDLRRYLVKSVDQVVNYNNQLRGHIQSKVCIDTAALNHKLSLLAASDGL